MLSACRRYYQPPSSYERQIRGLTGQQGKPLWVVLSLLLTVVGSSLAVAFGWATGCHWGLYAAFGGKPVCDAVQSTNVPESQRAVQPYAQSMHINCLSDASIVAPALEAQVHLVCSYSKRGEAHSCVHV